MEVWRKKEEKGRGGWGEGRKRRYRRKGGGMEG